MVVVEFPFKEFVVGVVVWWCVISSTVPVYVVV